MSAAAIFFIILTLVGSLTSYTVYSGVKNGELNKQLINPAKERLVELGKNLQKSSTLTRNNSSFDSSNINIRSNNSVTSRSTVQVNINSRVSTSSSGTKNSVQYVPNNNVQEPAPKTYTYDDSAYQQALKDQQAWSEQAKKANEQWFNDQVAKNKALYEQSNAQNAKAADQWYQDQIKKAQDAQTQWLKDHGF